MKTKILISALLIAGYSKGQIGTPPTVATTPPTAVTVANAAWYRGGNDLGGNAAGNNIFGTRWASNIWITANNELTAFFSHNNGLNGLNGTGDGLRIRNSFLKELTFQPYQKRG
jgi:hypothetical protein